MLTLGALGRDAWAGWRRDREVLTLLAGTFVFLPTFAWLLLVAEPAVPKGAANQEVSAILLHWAGANAHWLALRIAVELFAAAAVLTLYLSRDHRDVGGVLARAAALWPMFLVTVIASWGLVMVGIFAFVVPGLYIYGRVALAGPALIAEPKLGLAGAIARSIALTRGHGWQVFGYLGLTILAGALAVELIDGVGAGLRRAGAANPVALAMLAAVTAAAVTATVLARLLLEVALYRRLSAPRHHI
ncbi:MAG: hypothetical protein V4659_00890 [Pseudomonadota bacterium]